MKAVVQQERTGCGIATVAALAGVSYAQAKRSANRLGIDAKDRRLWCATDHVRRLVKHYGFWASPKEASFRSWASLPARALLAIKWHRQGGVACWHWVLFARVAGHAFVLDSRKGLKRHRRTDFHRMKPKWVLAVRKASAQSTSIER